MWCDLRMVDARAGEEEAYTEEGKGRASELEGGVALSHWLGSVGTSSFAQLFLVGALCSRAEFEGGYICICMV